MKIKNYAELISEMVKCASTLQIEVIEFTIAEVCCNGEIMTCEVEFKNETLSGSAEVYLNEKQVLSVQVLNTNMIESDNVTCETIINTISAKIVNSHEVIWSQISEYITNESESALAL